MSGPFKNMRISIFCKIDPDTGCLHMPIHVHRLKDDSWLNFGEYNLSPLDMHRADKLTLTQVHTALESAAHFVENQLKEGGDT